MAQCVTWSVKDCDIVAEAEYHLLENGGVDAGGPPAVWATTMYSPQQFIDALNDRQRRFLKDTGMVARRASLPSTPQISRYQLPDDWVSTRRTAWQRVGGKIYSLERVDPYELDHGMVDWEYNFALPTVFQETTTPTQTLEILKAPSDAGTIHLLYTALSQALDGSCIKLSIPDEFTPFIKWGAIGDLLKQDGEGNDPQRAEYCEMRYDQGVELAKLMLRGPLEAIHA